jgi:uncharacterized protein (UPF0303 family)
VIKNPRDQDLTFVLDPMKELTLLLNSHQHESDATAGSNNNNQKLVKKARHDTNRFSKSDLKNKSKQGLSKQSHSPVYE